MTFPLVNLTSSPPQTLPRKGANSMQQQHQQQAPSDVLSKALAGVQAPTNTGKGEFEFDASLDEVISRFDQASSDNLKRQQQQKVVVQQQQQQHHLTTTRNLTTTTSYISTSQTHLSVSQTMLHTSVSQSSLCREEGGSTALLSSCKSRTESQQEVGIDGGGPGSSSGAAEDKESSYARLLAQSKIDFEGRTTPSHFDAGAVARPASASSRPTSRVTPGSARGAMGPPPAAPERHT